MTIIIGIKCLNGIVVACDSQTTSQSGYKDDKAEKLHAIELQDGNQFIVGEAGSADFSSRALEIMSALAKKRTMEDYRSVAKCAEDSIAELRQHVRNQNKGSSSEELQNLFELNAFEWMIAHYYDGKPYIFTLGFTDGLAIKRDKLHSAIGCGCILAEFLISRLDLSGFGSGHGMWTAVYAVEEVKKFDSRCGGRTRAALITNKNGLSHSIVNPDDAPMDEAIKEALAFSDESKIKWRDTAEERIRAVIARRNNPR